MLESTLRTSAQNTLRGERPSRATQTNRRSLQSFASRFSAALGSSADVTANLRKASSGPAVATTTLEPSRSNLVAARPQNLLASPATELRNYHATGRNLLEIPMDQPPAVTKAQTAALYSPSQDSRDGVSDQAGKVTASGAPSVVRLAAPIANQWGYTGEAAYNPYFVTSNNPMREGAVTGYSQWFEANHIGGLSDAEMNPNYSATQEGAQEALRLVQKYDPGATLGGSRFGGTGTSPWVADKDTREIVLSNGSHVNAGLLLGSYYNHGQGVTTISEQLLQLSVKSS